MFLAWLLLLFSGHSLLHGVQGAVRLLKCHSVNQVPGPDVTEFVFISTKRDDCAFIFEGPEGSVLDIELRSITLPKQMADTGGCRKSKLAVYNYVDSKIILGKFLCQENEKSNVITKSNMGLITSSITDGSFSLKIKPTILSPENNFITEIDGMSPPNAEAKDFFFVEHRSNSADAGFRPLVWREIEDFRPSLPEQPLAEPVHDSYHQEPNRYYHGRPTAHIDLTYNSTGFNLTATPSRPHRPSRPTRPPRPSHSSRPTSHLESSTANHDSTSRPTLSNVTEPFKPTIPTDRTTMKTTTTEAPDED